MLLSGVLLFGFGVGQHVTHTKGFVLASLSGAHCGYMPPQFKNKMFPFCEKKTISVQQAVAEAKQTVRKHLPRSNKHVIFIASKQWLVCKKKTVSLRGGVNSAKIAADPKHDLLVCWFLLLGI